MARICRPNEEPPDGWLYTQPETGYRFKDETLAKIVTVVREHREWKGLQPVDAAAVRLDIERQICSGMPPGVCAPEPGEKYQPFADRARDMTLESLMEFSGASFRFLKSGGMLVDRTESARRAHICRGCRFNRPSPCTVCTPVFAMMDALIPKERIEGGLSACGICGCSLRAKILLPLETIRDADAPQHLRFPSYCWLNEHGET